MLLSYLVWCLHTLFYHFFFLNQWNDSKATNALSVTKCPGTKALWNFPIMSERTIFNLFAIVFEIILYITLQRDIGRKSVATFGFFFFGMRQINVWLRLPGFAPSFSTFRAKEMTFLPTMLQNCWKKVSSSFTGYYSCRIKWFSSLMSSNKYLCFG